MIVKLIEFWLDRINERGYQAAFCTALAAKGHTIVHTTRHSQIELGKDIITRTADGVIHKYQLKGHPGGRLTLSGLSELWQQLSTLVETAWSDESANTEQSYFVTNGLIEEEARLAIDRFNASLVARGKLPLHLLTRGDLLKLFVDQTEALFPSEPSSLRDFLELMSSRGQSQIDAVATQKMFASLFLPTDGTAAPEYGRRGAALVILAEILSTEFRRCENHFEVIKIQACAYAALMSWVHRFNIEKTASITALRATLREQIFAAVDLIHLELESSSGRLADSYMTDAVLIDWRREVISWLFSASMIEQRIREAQGLDGLMCYGEADYRRSFARYFVEEGEFWGEASQLAALIGYLGLSSCFGAGDSDKFLIRVLRSFAELHDRKIGNRFPNLYYGYEPVARSYLFPELARPKDLGLRDDFARRSRIFWSVFHLAVRKNLKRHAKSFWQLYIDYHHIHLTYDSLADVVRDGGATEVGVMVPDTGFWPDLLGDAEEHLPGSLLQFFDFDLSIAVVWLLYFPHRLYREFLLSADRVVQDSFNLQDRQRIRDDVLTTTRGLVRAAPK